VAQVQTKVRFGRYRLKVGTGIGTGHAVTCGYEGRGHCAAPPKFGENED